MKLVRSHLVVLVALFSLGFTVVTGPASADDPRAVVKGHGSGVLTDPDGNEFRLKSFRVRGTVADTGSARGTIRFLWRGLFPEVWGDPACAGTCDTITLTGSVESGSVAADGTVTLSGTAREVDKRRGSVVFDSGFDEPFYIRAGGSLGEDNFVLQWCLLPEFQIEGSLSVEVEDRDDDDDDDDDEGRGARATASFLTASSVAASSPSRAPCSR